MRITNTMTTNTVMLNINRNMRLLDQRYQQLATSKQIQFASQNPILASRTLKFRTTLAENEQFQRNLNQAQSFLEVSENAVASVMDMMQTIRELTVQGASDTLTDEDRQANALHINSLIQEIGMQMNQTYAGRNIFSGFRTDEPAVFSSQNDLSYRIKQEFTHEDIKNFQAYTKTGVDDLGEMVDGQRILLPYRHIDEGSIWIQPEVDAEILYMTSRELTEDGTSVYEPKPGQVIFVQDTGELILGSDVAQELQDLKPEGFSITYNKTGFEKGDLNPKTYFETMPWEADEWQNYFDNDIEDRRDMLEAKLQVLTANREALGIPDSLALPGIPSAEDMPVKPTATPDPDDPDVMIEPTEEELAEYYNKLDRIIHPALEEADEAIRDILNLVDKHKATEADREIGEGEEEEEVVLTNPFDVDSPMYEMAQNIISGLNETPVDRSVLNSIEAPEAKIYTMDNQNMQFELGIGIRINVNSLAKDIYSSEMHATFREFNSFVEGMKISSESDLRSKFSAEPHNLTGDELEKAINDQISDETARTRATAQTRFESLLGSIDGFLSRITEERTDMGARMARVNLIEERLQDDNLSFSNLLSQNEDADMAEVMTRLSMLDSIYQASLHVGMNIMKMTLVDFL